ncbi:GNAT family N-acetyltransferase [Variovorax sp. VNK109]|jgi:predicted GNAT family acetyltransferase|uniref:GNAT family N-acetyltransferase n=1 Tax=Variovorax sp. VNK109 TaxID=3400919 RepID=UPI003C056E57
MADITFTNNAEKHRYEIHSDGQLAGFCEYNVLTDALMFTHTEVLPAFEGQGLGSRLAKHVLDDVRVQGKHVIPVCQFIAGYLRKHPEYQDLVREDIRRAFKI